jgi:hypothetical protein
MLQTPWQGLLMIAFHAHMVFIAYQDKALQIVQLAIIVLNQHSQPINIHALLVSTWTTLTQKF